MQYELFRRYVNEKYPTKFHLADQLAKEFPRVDSTKKSSANIYLDECLTVGERMKNRRSIDRERRICYENFLLAEKLKSIEKRSKSKRKTKDIDNDDDDDQATAADIDVTSNFSSTTKPNSVDRLYQHLNELDQFQCHFND